MSKFSIWLRPGRAATLIQEQQQCLAGLEQECNGLREAGQAAQAEIQSLKQERSALQAANTESGLRHKKLEQEYENLQQEIDEVRAMFEKVSVMKQKYDRRIERYKAQVADLQRDLERERSSAPDDITPIRMTPPRPRQQPEPAPEKTAPDDSSADWYLPLDL